MKGYSEQLDDRYYGILEEEFDLRAEVDRLRNSGKHDMADALQHFMSALTAMPPRWSEAQTFGSELADKAYGNDRFLDHFRNAIMRALLPLLFDLPETLTEMSVALKWPNSKAANALAAAQIVRLFSNDFSSH